MYVPRCTRGGQRATCRSQLPSSIRDLKNEFTSLLDKGLYLLSHLASTLFFLFWFFETGFLCGPGWPRNHSVDQDGLKLTLIYPLRFPSTRIKEITHLIYFSHYFFKQGLSSNLRFPGYTHYPAWMDHPVSAFPGWLQACTVVPSFSLCAKDQTWLFMLA